MKKCKSCGKTIPEDKEFCNENCLRNWYEKREKQSKRKTIPKTELFKMELDMLNNSTGKKVELGLSRGRDVKGIVTAIDERYGKIMVRVKENNQIKNVIVRLGYIVSFAVYD